MKKKRTFTGKELRYLQTAAEEQQEKMRGGRLWRNADFLLYILVVIMFAFGIRRFIVEPIRVDGDSMVPTLINAELMIVDKLAYSLHGPARGDIVICFYPGYTESCVKRVVGLPGETVSVTDGKLCINGVILDESDYWTDSMHHDTAQVTVPPDAVFVMGDNRNYSKDSRSEEVGSIPYTKIVGRVRYVAWPLDRLARIEGVTY